MRVMLCGAGLDMTGANILLYRWGRHLRSQGHEVFALPRDGEAGPLRALYGAAGIQLVASGEAHVDHKTLVVCNTMFSSHMVIQASNFSRCIWWIHEGEVGAAVIGEAQLQRAFASASAVVFPAAYLIDSVYRSLLFGVPREKLFVVPNGVDAPVRVPPARSGDGAPLRIACVGTLYARKRQIDLVRAVEALSDLPIQCRLAGKAAAYEDDMRRIVEANPGRFQVLGEISQEETLALIEESDLLVHPSESEAMPLATLEAAIRGKPLVLANLPVYRDLWRHGENCLMHAAGDVALLAHLIAILARDPALRARFGAAAQATAAKYRTDVMLAQLDHVAARVAWPA